MTSHFAPLDAPWSRAASRSARPTPIGRAAGATNKSFCGEFLKLAGDLTDKLAGINDGQTKRLHNASVDNLIEFFQKFRRLNLHSSRSVLRRTATRCSSTTRSSTPRFWDAPRRNTHPGMGEQTGTRPLSPRPAIRFTEGRKRRRYIAGGGRADAEKPRRLGVVMGFGLSGWGWMIATSGGA